MFRYHCLIGKTINTWALPEVEAVNSLPFLQCSILYFDSVVLLNCPLSKNQSGPKKSSYPSNTMQIFKFHGFLICLMLPPGHLSLQSCFLFFYQQLVSGDEIIGQRDSRKEECISQQPSHLNFLGFSRARSQKRSGKRWNAILGLLFNCLTWL